jgi:hypothetical protein
MRAIDDFDWCEVGLGLENDDARDGETAVVFEVV